MLDLIKNSCFFYGLPELLISGELFDPLLDIRLV